MAERRRSTAVKRTSDGNVPAASLSELVAHLRKNRTILREEWARRITAALNERQRLARDLHDTVSQALFSANIIAESLPRQWQRDPKKH